MKLEIQQTEGVATVMFSNLCDYAKDIRRTVNTFATNYAYDVNDSLRKRRYNKRTPKGGVDCEKLVKAIIPLSYGLVAEILEIGVVVKETKTNKTLATLDDLVDDYEDKYETYKNNFIKQISTYLCKKYTSKEEYQIKKAE